MTDGEVMGLDFATSVDNAQCMSEMQSTHSTGLEWDLSDRLRKSLRVADLGVQEMADHLEVGRNTVGNYLSARTVPNPATLRVWAIRCGVPYRWLRDGEQPQSPDGGPVEADEQGSQVTRWYSAQADADVIVLRPQVSPQVEAEGEAA